MGKSSYLNARKRDLQRRFHEFIQSPSKQRMDNAAIEKRASNRDCAIRESQAEKMEITNILDDIVELASRIFRYGFESQKANEKFLEVIRFLGFEEVAVYGLDHYEHLKLVLHLYESDSPNLKLPENVISAEGFLGSLLHNKKEIFIGDFGKAESNMRSFVGIPLYENSTFQGTLILLSSIPQSFSNEKKDVIYSLATIFANLLASQANDLNDESELFGLTQSSSVSQLDENLSRFFQGCEWAPFAAIFNNDEEPAFRILFKYFKNEELKQRYDQWLSGLTLHSESVRKLPIAYANKQVKIHNFQMEFSVEINTFLIPLFEDRKIFAYLLIGADATKDKSAVFKKMEKLTGLLSGLFFNLIQKQQLTSRLSELEEMHKDIDDYQQQHSYEKMVRSVAHDFNNMFVSISGRLELLLEYCNDPSTKEELDTICRLVYDATKMIGRIRKLAKSDPFEGIDITSAYSYKQITKKQVQNQVASDTETSEDTEITKSSEFLKIAVSDPEESERISNILENFGYMPSNINTSQNIMRQLQSCTGCLIIDSKFYFHNIDEMNSILKNRFLSLIIIGTEQERLQIEQSLPESTLYSFVVSPYRNYQILLALESVLT
ncbi:MAG: hypothetical protein GF315_13160 [candidate division Zixibacteria bacterium]|nr:hypothetical protein [candidate division Zixibacteria bacterium]